MSSAQANVYGVSVSGGLDRMLEHSVFRRRVVVPGIFRTAVLLGFESLQNIVTNAAIPEFLTTEALSDRALVRSPLRVRGEKTIYKTDLVGKEQTESET